MTCRKVSTFEGRSGSGKPGGGGYATEAACLEACQEGACCDTSGSTPTCSVTPQCQCQGTGKTFKGIGTTCDPNPCTVCVCRVAYQDASNVFKPNATGELVSVDAAASRTMLPETVTVSYFSNLTTFSPPPAAFTGTYVLTRVSCSYLWSATITADGYEWTMYFGKTPPSSSYSIDEPGIWVSRPGVSYAALAAFLLGNAATSINMAQAMNNICYGGPIEYATQSGSAVASVSPNPLP